MAIRFCDRDVYCVNQTELDRGKLLSFFFQGHMEDIICVTEETGKFSGVILYKDLILVSKAEEALQKEWVRFDETIWEKAKAIFKNKKQILFLPVLNKDSQLEYFCYNDPSANYILRQIRELSALGGNLLIPEKYARVQCINLYDLNEVSYYLWEFFKNQNIQVNIYGEKWKIVNDCYMNCLKYPDYSIYQLYAERKESIVEVSKNLDELLCRDITGQFEIVEDIYKDNKRAGIIVREDFQIVLSRLSLEKRPVILYGASCFTEKVYNLLLKHNIRPVCLCTNSELCNGVHLKGKTLLGNPVYTYSICKEKYPDAVYIIAISEMKENDRKVLETLDYEGYISGEQSILLLDYIDEIEDTCLDAVLPDKKVVLTGDMYLCSKLYQFLTCSHLVAESEICFCNVLHEEGNACEIKMKTISFIDCKKDMTKAIYFILWKKGEDVAESDEVVKKIIRLLEENNISDISQYFNNFLKYLHEKKPSLKNKEKENTAVHAEMITRLNIEDCNSIIYGCTNARSGNVFIDSLLEGHPNILSLPVSVFKNCLWFYVNQLAESDKIDNLPEELFRIYISHLEMIHNDEFERVFKDADKFKQELYRTIAGKTGLSAKDIFSAIFIAYFYMQGREYRSNHIPVIYWEPHKIREKEYILLFAQWIRTYFSHYSILKLVRDPIKCMGSYLRDCIPKSFYQASEAIIYMGLECRILQNYKEHVCIVRFEDLKLYPEKVLGYLCQHFNIPWSDTLMTTTSDGKVQEYTNSSYSVKNFDLRPVYNQYEQYFSSFDLFRLSVLYREYRNAYGYSDMNMDMFSTQQILEWFQYPFLYEKYFDFGGDNNYYQFRHKQLINSKVMLQMQEVIEEHQEWFYFMEYYKV